MITFIEKIRTYSKWLLPVNMGFFSGFMGFIQAFYLVLRFFSNGMGILSVSVEYYFLVLFSLYTVPIFFQLVSAIFSRNRWLHLTGLFVGLIIYDLLIAYHFKTKEMLNWDVVTENFSNAWSPEAGNFILSSLDTDVLKCLVVFIIFFVILEYRRKTVTKGMQQRPLLPKVLSGFMIYVVCLTLPIESFDPLIRFSRTIWFYYNSPINRSVHHIQPTSSLIRTDADLHTGTVQAPRPEYVFLIIVESLNGSAIGKISEAGIPYTPFLNQLRDNSIYVDPFYGNSIHTSKGHFTTLFSVIPTTSGKEYKKYPDLRLRSIGDELSKVGYAPSFFTAYHNMDFDSEYEFLSKRGFPVYETAEPYLTQTEKGRSLTWGP
jgi:glucan phosphoethanolaminetransferase (alkaline phosphatase superfamily)